MKLLFLLSLYIIFLLGVRLFGNKLSPASTRIEWFIFWLKSSLFTGLAISLFLTIQDVYTKNRVFETGLSDSYELLIKIVVLFIVYSLPGFFIGLVMNAIYISKRSREIKSVQK